MRQSFHQTTNYYSADVFGGLGRNDVLDFDYGWTFNKVDTSKNPGRIGDRLIHFVRLKTEGWHGWATELF
jgi:hypothetical protein